MLNKSELVSPWGRWQIEDDGESIVTVDYWQQAPQGCQSALAAEAQRQLERYLEQPDFVFDLPLKPVGTEFQLRLWRHLQAIPSGHVETYGQAAEALGSAARAIGGACRANPIPLFIPCHRIIAKNGLGGFSGHTQGERIDLKRQLLHHEGVC